jgi:hypothetical protein
MEPARPSGSVTFLFTDIEKRLSRAATAIARPSRTEPLTCASG